MKPPLLLFLLAPLANSEWSYIEPLYACSPTISNCNAATHQCLANPNHPQSTNDDECAVCSREQKYWPCDVDNLCYCWEIDSPKIPPAPSTRTYQGGKGLNVSNVDPCDIVTEKVFKTMSPEAMHPYSYDGFCQAVHTYNFNHPDEGVFNMGNREQQKAELAAFFGNSLHESDNFIAPREYLMCADSLELGGEIYCRPCDASSFDWEAMKCPEGGSLASEGRAFNNYCQSNLLPPEGCECDDVYERSSSGPMAGYVKANEVYFGRGAIQLSWNYNYIRASVALTGAPQTFCQRPDLVAINEEYAWGAGLYYWMENVKNDKTCHQSVLLNEDFGETLDNINGGMECPADDMGWHGKAIQKRLNRYCHAANAIGVKTLLSLDGCMDMKRRMRQCLDGGNCPECKVWEDTINWEGGDEAAAAESDVEATPICNKPNKEKCKQQQQQQQATDKDKDKDQQQQAKDKDKEQQQQQQQQQAAAEENDKDEQETSKPTSKPTPKPVSSKPTAQPTTSTYFPTYPPTEPEPLTGPCTGLPCQIPDTFADDIEFCRSSDGVCGAGPQYCNAYSTWTSFCHDCDSSTYGCPTFGCIDNCHGDTQSCRGNLNAKITVSDRECEPCGFGINGVGQEHWPCDKAGSGGCWCWNMKLPRVEPSPPSGLELDSSLSSSFGQGVCSDLLDGSTFRRLAPNAMPPFTYSGFCQAIDMYNSHHAEKVFRMGSREQRLGELAAFLGVASHETNGFTAAREYLACGDNVVVDGELYCKPCESTDYDYTTHTCRVSMVASDKSYMNFCQPYTTPPDGCNCEYVKQVDSSGALAGYVRANDIFFGRGSIQLTHNFNYIRASSSMTGDRDTFCSQPELLAEVESWAWGVGLYIWMEHVVKESETCHTHALAGDFGAALNVINGGNECPVEEDDSGWRAQAVRSRLDHYCHAAKVVGVTNLLLFSGCEKLENLFLDCLENGSCPRCSEWHPALASNNNPVADVDGGDALEAQGSNRNFCGTTWEEASSNCNEPCDGGSDEECTNPDHICYADTSCGEDGPSAEVNRNFCGATWDEASSNCNEPCHSGLDEDCTNLEHNCYANTLCDGVEEHGSSSATNEDDDDAVFSSSSAGMPSSVESQPPQGTSTTPRPTNNPTRQPTKPPVKASASSFAASQLSISQTHSKPSNENAEPGNGPMTNWANTKLEDPPSSSPVVSPKDAPTLVIINAPSAPKVTKIPLPTKKPIKVIDVADAPPPTKLATPTRTPKPIKVINIADAYQSSPNDKVDNNSEEMAVEQSAAVETTSNNNESNQKEEGPATAPASSTASETSHEYAILDDATISRASPSTNFGSDPSIVIDMLEGDAALLRFDLSTVGDRVIKKAVLRLTPIEEDGTTSGAGAYYIQPIVNDWKEEKVTYNSSPKADGTLFASVATIKDGKYYELDVTGAAANRVISFRVAGTDRVGTVFSSKENSHVENIPMLVVELESPKAGISSASGGATAMQSSQSASSSETTTASSPLGSISGIVWLDKNANGLHDSSEPGLRGMLVDLYQCTKDEWLEGTRTSSGGEYMFDKLEEGKYYVAVTLDGDDLSYSVKDAALGLVGYDGTIRDSNVERASGRGDCIELSSSSSKQLLASVNAGIVKSMPEITSMPGHPDKESESESAKDSTNYNCRGKPCIEGPTFCRSSYNFCGTTEEYCNEDSQWTIECGTPNPTYQPSNVPTTGIPTFVHDPDLHCSGERCNEGDGTWCRSEIGYCGNGALYCNPDSTWMPDCDAPLAGDDSGTDVPTSEKVPTITPILLPTGSDAEFSPFVLPTLSEIGTPSQAIGTGTRPSVDSNDATASPSSIATPPNKGDESSNQGVSNENLVDDQGEDPWYVRYADMEPVSRNVGSSRSSIPGIVLLHAIFVLGLL